MFKIVDLPNSDAYFNEWQLGIQIPMMLYPPLPVKHFKRIQKVVIATPQGHVA